MSGFNTDFSWWLDYQKEILKDNDVQKILYEIEKEHLANFGNITDRERHVLGEIISSFLKLSFILKNSPTESEKLIQYLS